MAEDCIEKTGPLFGYLVALVSLICSTLSATTAQALQGSVPDFQLAITRYILQALVYFIIGKAIKMDFSIERESIPALVILGLAYMVYHVGVFGATTFMPLVEVSAIFSIMTIISAFTHSKVMHGVDITKGQIIACIVCIIGLILAIQPEWLFHDSHICQHLNNSTDAPRACQETSITGWIFAIVAGIGFGVTYDINALRLQDVKPLLTALFCSVQILVASVLFLCYFQDPVFKLTLHQLLLVLGHGSFSAVTLFCDIQVARLLSGPRLALVYSYEVLLMLLSQYTLMHSIMPGKGNWLEVLGSLVLIIGGSLAPIIDIIMHRRKADELP